MQANETMIADEVIMSQIYLVRGYKVMIDRDLAALYGVETKRLKEAVRRNLSRFPEDFMFQMDKTEFEQWSFTRMRGMLLTHKDILLQLEKIEKRLSGHDEQIQTIFHYLKKLINPPQPPRQRIGFRRNDE